MTKSVVCTLFEGHYHYGVAALINSLYKNGFRGNFFAGYRGNLPKWANSAVLNKELNWEGAHSLEVADGLKVHFLPVQTSYHLTNYKPDFMLQVWDNLAVEANNMYYFDPDILIKCEWLFFEKWVAQRVAVIHEITSNDMPPNHPLRLLWFDVIKSLGRTEKRELFSYINGGFIGLGKANLNFLKTWKSIQELAVQEYGFKPNKFMPSDRTNLFYATDQDALNITAMCCDEEISEVGPEGMDFIHGGWIMSHAVGSPKPWKKQYIIEFLKGSPPSMADKQYWKNVDGVIKTYRNYIVSIKKFEIRLSAFLGRFYRKY